MCAEGRGRGTLQGETDLIPYSAREGERARKVFFPTQFFARFVLRPGDERGGVIPTFALMLCARVIKKQFLLFALGGRPSSAHTLCCSNADTAVLIVVRVFLLHERHDSLLPGQLN